MSDDQTGYDLVMPFIPVQSKGGPHDDAAYVAGYEMGKLDAELAAGYDPQFGHRTIHSENAGQADLIAMRHGWAARVTPTGTDGWSQLDLDPGEIEHRD